MLRHIQAIVSNQNSLWVQWSRRFIIKSNCFWNMRAPCDCSWTWRKLVQLRHFARPFVRFIIGDGSSTFFWYDNWHTVGPFIDHLGSNFAVILGIPLMAKVFVMMYGLASLSLSLI